MSHKKKSNLKEKWSKAQTDAREVMHESTPNMVQYVTRLAITLIISFILSIGLWLIQPWLGALVLVLPIIISLCLLHESLHWFMAKHLNYDNLEWFNSRLFIPYTNKSFSIVGFDVLYSDKKKWSHDKWKIAYAPYIAIMPLNLLMMLLGYSYSNSTLLISGSISLILHALLISTEGRNI